MEHALRPAMLDPADDLRAARLRALAHPARLAILRALAARGSCVCGELVETMPLAQSTVSQHLKVLREAGLIRGSVEGPRSCYCIDHEAVAAVSRDIEGLFAGLRASASACVGAPNREGMRA